MFLQYINQEVRFAANRSKPPIKWVTQSTMASTKSSNKAGTLKKQKIFLNFGILWSGKQEIHIAKSSSLAFHIYSTWNLKQIVKEEEEEESMLPCNVKKTKKRKGRKTSNQIDSTHHNTAIQVPEERLTQPMNPRGHLWDPYEVYSQEEEQEQEEEEKHWSSWI